jgi:hypothetical protein
LNSIITKEQQQMRALFLVSNDQIPPQIDAVYIHGSSIKSKELDTLQLKLGAKIFRDSPDARHIVIAGTPQADCGKIAYAGVEPWHEELADLVDEADIVHTPRVMHTAAECKELVKMAAEAKYNWKNIVIVTLPHHAPRVMRTWAAVIKGTGSDLKVYVQSPRINPRALASKPVLDKDGGTIEGTVMDHVDREFMQGEKFEDKSGIDAEGNKFTPHATLVELIEYFDQRDGVIPAAVEAPAETPVAQVPEPATA